MKAQKTDLVKKYPRSEPCGCSVCLNYCRRPGWWLVLQASRALQAGYGGRMMLEISPDRTFAVLSPAFKGCEGNFSIQGFSDRGCNFLQPDFRCELHGTPFLPLECAFCHHDRIGQGKLCHDDIGRQWQTPEGKILVRRWCKSFGWWDMLDAFNLGFLREW